jgi:ferredoxin-NADP reductase
VATHLYLVQHGSTPLTTENRFAGRLAKRLYGEGIPTVYPGSLSRALDMVRILPGAGASTLQLRLAVLVLLAPMPVGAQTPDEHQQHHPAAPAETLPATSQPEVGKMGGMMMGSPPPKAVYPSLMGLPELPADRRPEFEHWAGELMLAGTTLMSAAFEGLTASTQLGDAAAMQEASARVREGLAQFESGLALRRALAEGRAPRDVALDWFRREMNLVPLTSSPPPHGLFGLSWFHYIVMSILTAFAIAMVAMYFRKMRRAEALVARLGGSAGGPVAVSERPPPSGAPPPVAVSVAASVGTTARESVMRVPPAEAPSKPNSWTGLVRVARIFQETPSVRTFRLTDPAGGLLPFVYLPGQFLTLTVRPDGDTIKRSYTIASSPTQRAFAEITVKREEQGAVSRFLHGQVTEGDTLQITAPSGRFTFTGDETSAVVLLAGGVGVTPLMSYVRYLTSRAWSGEIFLFFAVQGEADIIFREELEYLEKRHPNLHLIIVAEQVEPTETRYVRGRITRELLESKVPQIASRRLHVHICGPPPMMNALKSILAEIGVSAEEIFTEIFGGREPSSTPLASVPAAQAKVAVVTFAKSRQTAVLSPTKTVLEASEDVGVNIEYSCRVGICGVCRTRLLSGVVTMEVQDGLEPGDKEANIILACQAKSTADLSVDV